MELALQAHADGTIVPVRAQPGARRAGITGVHAGALKVAVAEPPEKGKANEAIAAVLASSIGCRPAQVTLLSGPTSRQKKFFVQGFLPDQVRSILHKALDPGL